MQNFLTKSAILAVLFSAACFSQTINTVFGKVEERNPAILSVLHSQAMERLKNIDQSGPEPYFVANFPTFSRYDHSVGVYALLKRYNVTEKEQLAGLLHDASHTVFSHLADVIFQSGDDRSESYQDSIHAWYLQKTGVDKILAQYNLTINDVNPKRPEYTALEQAYPDMNADRIEYNLHTGMVFHDLTDQDSKDILATLKYDNDTWYFTDAFQAKRFAKLSTYYTKSLWGSPRNIAVYTVAAAAIRRAIDLKIVSKEDFHFGVDQDIVNKLNSSNDTQILKLLRILENIENHYTVGSAKNFDVHQPVKMRGINPYVLHDNNLVRLSEICVDFKSDLASTEQYTKHGIYIKFINIDDSDLVTYLKHANT